MSGNKSDFDVLILGAGPAGISAAFWCAELGLSAMLLEASSELGGQLLQIYNPIDNYLGLHTSNGREMSEKFLQDFHQRRFTFKTGVSVRSVDLASRSIVVDDEKELTGRMILIATGVLRRRLGVPGESEFQENGVLRSGSAERDKVRDRAVLIVGGGDAALENACILGQLARKVYVAHRGSSFSARNEFIVRASEMSNVEFLFNTAVESIMGSKIVDSIRLCDQISGKSYDLPIDAVLIRIGVEPNTSLFRGQIALDERGYVIVDASCKTSLADIYAAGDVANPDSPTINTAVGMGTTAAKSIFRKLTS